MDEVVSSFTLAIDELNILTAESYESVEGSDYATRVEHITDDFLSFLIRAYTLGIRNASLMVHQELPTDVDRMYEAIFVLIDGKTFEDRVADHVRTDSLGLLQTLAESEFHRVYNRAVDDGGRYYTATGNHLDKTWYTMLDERVRGTHQYLEQMTVPFEAEFYTYDGDHTFYPGGFTKVKNNANCRCIVLLKP